MIEFRILLVVFAFLAPFFASPQTYATEQKFKLACPAAWPETPAAKIRRIDFTVYLRHQTPIASDTNPSPHRASPGDELYCAYSNGRSLLIAIPGAPLICYVADARNSDPSQIKNGYCTYQKTGDPAKDTVRIREMEPLDRSTSFYGVKLGMTHAQVAAAMASKASLDGGSDRDQETYILADTRQIIVRYIRSLDRVYAIQIKPALGRSAGLLDEMRERFGFPEWNSTLDQPTWRGQDKVRLVAQTTDIIGDHLFPDETVFLIDNQFFQDIDREFGLDGD